MVIIDEILMYSKDAQEHEQDLKIVLRILREKKLFEKLSVIFGLRKCNSQAILCLQRVLELTLQRLKRL